MRYVCKNPPGGGTKPLSAHRLFALLYLFSSPHTALSRGCCNGSVGMSVRLCVRELHIAFVNMIAIISLYGS